MFDDNFDTVKAPDPNIKHTGTMDRLFKTNRYKYDNPFGNEHTYLFSYGELDIHPDKLSPNLETCQEWMAMATAHDDNNSATLNKTSTENNHNNKSILRMQYLVILHDNIIFPQNSKDDFKAYKHLHGIDMQIHSIPKPPKQKAHEMGLSDLQEKEYKLFAMEYNTTNNEPDNELDHYVNTLERKNEDYDPGFNPQQPRSNILRHANAKPRRINTRTNENTGGCEQIHRCTKTRYQRINGHKHFRIHPQNQITS
jgi:hypothetical protein